MRTRSKGRLWLLLRASAGARVWQEFRAPAGHSSGRGGTRWVPRTEPDRGAVLPVKAGPPQAHPSQPRRRCAVATRNPLQRSGNARPNIGVGLAKPVSGIAVGLGPVGSQADRVLKADWVWRPIGANWVAGKV